MIDNVQYYASKLSHFVQIASYLLVKTYHINKGLEKMKMLKPDILMNAIIQNIT